MQIGLSREVLGGQTEQCAVMFASRVNRSAGGVRFIVREIDIPGPETYTQKSVVSAELNPAFVAKVSRYARTRGDSIIFVHSHPGDVTPEFSQVDDFGEERLARFLVTRMPGVPHGAVVISAGGWCGRELAIPPTR